MTNIAILGFGVVGGGVADLITNNKSEVEALGGDGINIKYILDLRDFPGSPFEKKVVHNYDVIVNDESVDTVIELMGGSHPAYEYTLAALKAGKNVISSNKEVVANFGDEFLTVAKENGVTYRFEAAVGGGIPVISPMISFVKQNKLSEIRGILNGTTNYILTKMFTFGDSFESALKDAQERGYAEKNPDADVLGLDAARKICILGAIASGKLVSPDNIHVEGITKIRSEDVCAVEKIGASIKLVGRCIIENGALKHVLVAPFVISKDGALAGVSGVYNAVEAVGEPLGNVMFYGRGAGAGATASAVVGDLMQVMRTGAKYAEPSFEKTAEISDFGGFVCKNYVACEKGSEALVEKAFGKVSFIDGGECAFLTEPLSENEMNEKLQSLNVLSRIRLL
jgi:homoserine dehydrogenase